MDNVVIPKNMRGGKWLAQCAYITDKDKAYIMREIERCKSSTGERVGVRCPSYIGEPHPIATIEYGPGRRIWKSIYKSA